MFTEIFTQGHIIQPTGCLQACFSGTVEIHLMDHRPFLFSG
jgi:hypothetical protein